MRVMMRIQRDYDGIALLQRLLEKAASLVESKALQNAELQAVLLDELDCIANVSSSGNQRHTFFQALQESQSVLCELVEAVYAKSNPTYTNQFGKRWHSFLEIPDGLPDSRTNCSAEFLSLPAETISYIFQLAVKESYSPHILAIRLCSINKRCRAIGLNLPELWTRLSGDLRPELLSLFLERSSLRGLSLTIRVPSVYINNFMTRMIENKGRVSSVNIQDSASFDLFMDSFECGDLTSLSTLQLGWYALNEGFDRSLLSLVCMPNLNSYEGVWFYPDEDLSWTANLTECTLLFSCFDNGLISTAQFQLPNCITLRLQFRSSDKNVWHLPTYAQLDTFNQASSLPKLKSLLLEISESYHLEIAEEMIECCIPTYQLEVVEVHSHYRLDAFPRAFSRLPFDNLRTLKIHYDKILLQDGIVCTESNMPKLENLEFNGISSLITLYYYLGDVRALASLKRLTFNHCYGLNEKLVLEFVDYIANKKPFKDFQQLQFSGCQLQRSFLHRLDHLIPGKLRWDQ